MTEPIPDQPSKPSVTTIHPSHSTSTVPITKKTPSRISWTGQRGMLETASGASSNVGGEVGAGVSATTPRRQSSPGSSGMHPPLLAVRFGGYLHRPVPIFALRSAHATPGRARRRLGGRATTGGRIVDLLPAQHPRERRPSRPPPRVRHLGGVSD